MNHFELFGLPLQFQLDGSLLSSQFRDLQRQFHPDKFATASERDRLLAVQKAAQINGKNLKEILTTKRIIFIAIFTILVFVGKKINFSPLVGAENQFFTLFQFFGPIAGGFLGPLFGAIAVLFAELIDFFIVGKETTLLNILRFTPMLFAAYYFGSKKGRIKKKICGIWHRCASLWNRFSRINRNTFRPKKTKPRIKHTSKRL